MASCLLYVCWFVGLLSAVFAAPAENGPKPAFDCTKPNERYVKCVSQVCLTECKHLANSPACTTEDCNNPACICNEGYLRNENGVCVLQARCKEAKPDLILHVIYD